jgi:hypothetical protein
MRRLLRILLNVATVLSLLLCVSLLVLFATVDFSGDQPEWWSWRRTDGSAVSVELAKEKIECFLAMPWKSTPVSGWGRRNLWVVEYQSLSYVQLGRKGIGRQFSVRTGPLFLLGMIIPACNVIGRFLRRRKREDGRCLVCGYDLRATPDRCPECGKVPDALSSNAPARSSAAPP